MLYNPDLQNKSYETTKEIADMFNDAVRCNFPTVRGNLLHIKEFEDGESDGSIGEFKVELKQRQNHYIEKCVKKEREPYPDTTIHKSSTTHGSDIFIIYDLSMRYCQVYLAQDIVEEEQSREEHTERGDKRICYYSIPTEKTIFLDLLDKEAVGRVTQWMKHRLVV